MTQTNYITSKEAADFMDWGTVYRQESLTTSGDGSTLYYSLSQSSIISGSVQVVYNTAGTTTTQGFLESDVLTSSAYTVDLDNGVISFTTSGASTLSGSSVWANYEVAPFRDSIIQSVISQASREVERATGRRFDDVTGSIQYFTPEPAQKIFYTDGYPHTATPTVERNLNSVTDVENWETLTSGAGASFLSTVEDKKLGRIRLFDNFPSLGTDRLRVTYNYGYTSSADRPLEIKRLTNYNVALQVLLNPVFTKSVENGFDKFIGLSKELLQSEIDRLTKELSNKRHELI